VTCKALVVDDSRAIRMILSNALEKLGWEVCEASNGREALSVLERQNGSVSLVLIDWNMPEMNGLELVRAVRADPHYADVKLMMVTTETQVEQMMTALEAGANEYLMKPFDKAMIEGKLRILGLVQEQQEVM